MCWTAFFSVPVLRRFWLHLFIVLFLNFLSARRLAYPRAIRLCAGVRAQFCESVPSPTPVSSSLKKCVRYGVGLVYCSMYFASRVSRALCVLL